MPRLSLTGDTDKTLGQFLPAPYIEKIILYGNSAESDANNRFVVRTNLMVPNEPETVLYNSGMSVVKSAYKEQLEELHYYIIYFYVNTNASGEDEADAPGYAGRVPVKYYEDIVNNELNPFRYYYERSERIVEDSDPGGTYFTDIIEFNPLSSTAPELAYDEAGNEYLNYVHDESVYLPESPSSSLPQNWLETKDLKFIVFSSTKLYEDVEDFIEDTQQLNIVTGDISYETIYENGEIGDPERARYFDANDQIYQETPLLDLGSVAHKLTTVTQDDIVNNFQQLLDQYSKQYNSDSGFVILKKMMDNISVILNTMADSPGILVALQQLVPTFPDKTPSKPIGKFYKSFRKRLFNFNNTIKTGEILRSKIVYDSKIVDLREFQDLSLVLTDYVEGELVDGVYRYNQADLEGYETEEYSNYLALLELADSYEQQAEESREEAQQLELEIEGMQRGIADGVTPEYAIPGVEAMIESRTTQVQELYLQAETFEASAELVRQEAQDMLDSGLARPPTAERFIYSSNLMKEFTTELLESRYQPDDFLSINFGYYFFDYEKALLKTSNISKVFNVSKLEAFGIPIPYQAFSLVLAQVGRESTIYEPITTREPYFTPTATTLYENVGLGNATIMCDFESKSFPMPDYIYTLTNPTDEYEDRSLIYNSPYDVLENSPDAGYTVMRAEGTDAVILDYINLIENQPYSPSGTEETSYRRIDDLNQGFVSSLIVRPFSDPSNVGNGYGIGQSPIPNYRLLMFQLLDYVWNRQENEYGQYTAEVYIVDKTNQMFYELVNDFSSKYEAMLQYLEYAQELCAFNNNTQTFNDFFLDEISQIYGDDPANYPWVSAPVVLQMHLDLLYNTYNGDLDIITTKAAEIALQIAPSTGNLANIETIVELMREINNEIYARYVNEDSDDYVDPSLEKINLYTEKITFYGANVDMKFDATDFESDVDVDDTTMTGGVMTGGGGSSAGGTEAEEGGLGLGTTASTAGTGGYGTDPSSGTFG
jgi:hypothetical protein